MECIQRGFFKNYPAISLLKLRASYGVLGNQDIGDYQYLGLIQPAYTMTIGAGSNCGPALSRTPYPATNIKWESTATSNFGADLSLFKGKLDFTADYFTKTHDGSAPANTDPAFRRFRL